MGRKRAFPPTLALCCAVLTAGCGGGGSSTSSPPPLTVSVSVSPAKATVGFGGPQQFTATVTGTGNTAVTWAVNTVTGGNTQTGTVSSAGLYTAPSPSPLPDPFSSVPAHPVLAGPATTGVNVDLTPEVASSTVTVTATSQADPTKSASATVTIAPLSLFAVGTCVALQCTAGSTGANSTQGQTTTLFIVGQGLQSGDQFAISGNDITIASTTFTKTDTGEAAAEVTINVSGLASVGPRNIMVKDPAGELAAFPGGLLICSVAGCAN